MMNFHKSDDVTFAGKRERTNKIDFVSFYFSPFIHNASHDLFLDVASCNVIHMQDNKTKQNSRFHKSLDTHLHAKRLYTVHCCFHKSVEGTTNLTEVKQNIMRLI
jgi:hypothetical protein